MAAERSACQKVQNTFDRLSKKSTKSLKTCQEMQHFPGDVTKPLFKFVLPAIRGRNNECFKNELAEEFGPSQGEEIFAQAGDQTINEVQATP
jgi:23S rRNA U2552 (ribose-2'-O)-methylase RlmE/FtsJ